VASPALSPAEYVRASERWVEAGATWIGGCCDTRPDYIAALSARWRPRASRS
jgi:S-methylmethionine-dependent homocysteine/selenocysteine methylase